MHLGDFGSVAAKLPRCRVGRPHHWSISDMRQSSLSDNYGDSVSPSVRFGLPFERSGYIISLHTSTSFDPRHCTNPQQFDPSRLCRAFLKDVP